MKLSESWLREWVNPKLTQEALCSTLTMAGFEVEELAPVAERFTGIVVGEILSVEKHLSATGLTICKVDVGKGKSLQIVCGASNAKKGMKVPVALLKACLPNGKEIKEVSIQNISSEGMLCSANEIGLSEEGDVLLELSKDAPIGKNLWDYLDLTDYSIDIAITPNRGDCLSVRGMAREISAITKTPLKKFSIPKVKVLLKDELPLKIVDPKGCPHYVGRIIRDVKSDLITPGWLKERLRRSGLRSISPIVDITNYVMLELGQPMHAFDLNTLHKGMIVRQAKKGEFIKLLDGTEKHLDDKTLIIADHENPLAIAGVMGGLDSSVTLLTKDIFLESAYFSPEVVARARQHYQLNSDSAYRFERGVDPTIQKEAIERATQLIIEIVGGKPGPTVEKTSKPNLPKYPVITLSKKKLDDTLGLTISASNVDNIFKRLHIPGKKAKKETWLMKSPSFRFDLAIPEDLIEEVARLYGYEKIPVEHLKSNYQTNKIESNDWSIIRQILSGRGFNEVISYSFIDKKLQALLDPEEKAKELVNPITADMTVMRTNLWPGLINAWLYNKSRQQQRANLFELGTCFVNRQGNLGEELHLAGLITGLVNGEQWGFPSREVDFYDLKGVIENLLIGFCKGKSLEFKTDKSHPALHPKQSAEIYLDNQKVGILGSLHPVIMESLDLSSKMFVFELNLDRLPKQVHKQLQDISKFPEIRRDLALVVNEAIPAKDIQDTIRNVAGDWLKDIFIFDVYQGKGITSGRKSIALALILQHPTRTLVDSEVAELMDRVITTLKGQLGAELRS